MEKWRGKLAKAVLWQAAKDMRPERPAWLATETCKELCAEAEVDHDQFTTAMTYLLKRSPVQRAVLLRNLKKNIGA